MTRSAQVIGQTIAHYTITEKIGQGGMGEVYRATDTKLKRDVALKILPESFAQDPQRMGRFQREAEVLASLNHPNIAGIHGLEQEGSTHAIAMELVEGDTLAARISKRPIPVEEALKIALQIAEALEAAHEKGIIHRDLKPANVIVTPGGTAKVLDFGLAKAMDPEPTSQAELSQSPTLTMQATQAGIILGTAAFMSPEQVRGEEVDKRADIWSFGVCLFQMLTGHLPFKGPSLSDTLASVLKVEPDWSKLPTVSDEIQRLMRRCLAKDRDRRLRDIGDAILEIDESFGESELRHQQAGVRPSIGVGGLALAGLALIAVSALATLGLVQGLRPESSQEVRRITIPTPGLVTAGAWPKISPDGKKALYYTGDALWVHYFDRFDSQRVDGVSDAESPFFSADSQRIAFRSGPQLWQVRLDGSERRIICEIPGGGQADGLWRSDDTILFSTPSGGLYEVPSLGGTPIELVEPGDRAGMILSFELSASGGYVYSSFLTGGVELLRNGLWTSILAGDDVISAAYSKTGHLLFHRMDAGLWAAPFSISTGEVTGGSFLVDPLGGPPSLSDAGRLLYARGRDRSELVRVSRDGTILETLGTAQFLLQDPAMSPDGRWVAVFAREQGRSGIWLHDVQGGTARRLTFEKEPLFVGPTWSPDGEVFYSTRDGGIWRQNAAGGRQPIKVAEGLFPHMSSNGRFLAFNGPSRATESGATANPILYMDWREDDEPRVFLDDRFDYGDPRISPDGKWLAYSSNEVGKGEVFVRRFPSGEGPWQISVSGGQLPRWSAKGDEIFYVDGRDIMAVPFRTEEGFKSDKPEKVVSLLAPPFKEYEVALDGQSFILVRPSAEIDQLAIVDHWFAPFQSSGERGQ